MARLGDWAQFLLGIMPVIQLVVSLIEKLFSGSTGEDKKMIAMDALRYALPNGPGGLQVPNSILSKMVDNEVEVFNGLGIFEHKGSGGSSERPPVPNEY